MTRLVANLPDGELRSLQVTHGLPETEDVTRQVCRLWEETQNAFRSALHTLEQPALPAASIRQAVDYVIKKTGLCADRIYTWERDHVQSAVHQVLRAALTLKYCA